MIEILSYPRLHACLLDLAGVTGRKFGGAGFTIDGLPTRVFVDKGAQMDIRVEEEDPALADCIAMAAHRTSTYLGRHLPAIVRVAPPTARHVGLGSCTAVVLGFLEGMRRCFDLPLTPYDIRRISGRGGTSGIGINTFFAGGFVVDGGHPQDKSGIFLPSSSGARHSIPPVMFRSDIPKYWRFYLYVPQNGILISGTEEATFFRANAPVPAPDVYQSISAVYHSLCPAVHYDNLQLLRSALSKISSLGFKRREIDGQSKDVRLLLDAFSGYPNCAVGMSSMGPLVYVVADLNDDEFRLYAERVITDVPVTYLGSYPGRNSGFGVSSD